MVGGKFFMSMLVAGSLSMAAACSDDTDKGPNSDGSVGDLITSDQSTSDTSTVR